MPRFSSEEQRQNWLASCARTRAENKMKKASSPKALAMGFQDQTTEKKRGRPPKTAIQHVPAEPAPPVVNLGAVEEINSLITALTLVRDILNHTRGLVSA